MNELQNPCLPISLLISFSATTARFILVSQWSNESSGFQGAADKKRFRSGISFNIIYIMRYLGFLRGGLGWSDLKPDARLIAHA